MFCSMILLRLSGERYNYYIRGYHECQKFEYFRTSCLDLKELYSCVDP